MRLKTVLGIAVFSLGVLALVSAIYFRSVINAIKLDSVHFQIEMEGFFPKFQCTIKGVNPSFFTAKVTSYDVAVGQGQLPVTLLLSSKRALAIPSGKFSVTLDLFQDGDNFSWQLGGGIGLSFLDGIKYKGALRACTSLFCSTLKFKGTMALE